MAQDNGHLQARVPGGGTPRPGNWGVDSEYGTLREVLLGPVESFHWMEDNAAYSSIVRDTLRKGRSGLIRIADGDPINRVNLLCLVGVDRFHRNDRTRVAGSIVPDPV